MSPLNPHVEALALIVMVLMCGVGPCGKRRGLRAVMRVGSHEGSRALIKGGQETSTLSPPCEPRREAGHVQAWRNLTLPGTLTSSFQTVKNKGLLLKALVLRDKSIQ